MGNMGQCPNFTLIALRWQTVAWLFLLQLECWQWCAVLMLTGETGTVTETVRTVRGIGTETETVIGTETGTENQSHLVPHLTAHPLLQPYHRSSKWSYNSRSTHSPTCPILPATMRSWRRGYSFQCGSTRKASLTSSHVTKALCLSERLAPARQHRYEVK